MLHPSCNVHLPCTSTVSHPVLLWVVLLVSCCYTLAYERGTMSVWDFIKHHLDITSAASHYLPVTSPPTWCCSIRSQGITNLTCRDSSQWLTANPAFIFSFQDMLPSTSHVSGPRFAQILHILSPDRLLRGSCLGVSANHRA